MQTKYRHEFYGVVRQGAHLNLVITEIWWYHLTENESTKK
jgi:hypothetical protein